MFVMNAFSSYHALHPNVVLCVMGPILDADYAASFFSHLPPDHIVGLPSAVSYPKAEDLYQGVFYMRWSL